MELGYSTMILRFLSITCLLVLKHNGKEFTLLKSMTEQDRPIRIALRLLSTATKHSQGRKAGYEKE